MRGSIAFSHNAKGLLPKLIQWFTESEWNHTFIVVSDEYSDGTYDIIEAGTRVVKRRMSLVSRKDYSFVIFQPRKIVSQRIERAIARVEKKIGNSYGWGQLFGFAFVIIAGWFGWKIERNPVRGGVICSELVFEYLEAIDKTVPEKDEDTISPKDLYFFMSKSPDFEAMLPSDKGSES